MAGPGERSRALGTAILAWLLAGVQVAIAPLLGSAVAASLLDDGARRLVVQQSSAVLMIGAAFGAPLLGHLGDRFGRVRILSLSLAVLSLCSLLGGLAQSFNQFLLTRALVGVGVGGIWASAVVLAAENSLHSHRALGAGALAAAGMCGALFTLQFGWLDIPVYPWRGILLGTGVPVVLAPFLPRLIPEPSMWSPVTARNGPSNADRRPIARPLVLAALLGVAPLLGIWNAAQWLLPWAAAVGDPVNSSYGRTALSYWLIGAVVGSALGSPLGQIAGRRAGYVTLCLGTIACGVVLFGRTQPLWSGFLHMTLLHGFLTATGLGLLALYLPEMFPTERRALGVGAALLLGGLIVGCALFGSDLLFATGRRSFSVCGRVSSVALVVGLCVIGFAPETLRRSDPG